MSNNENEERWYVQLDSGEVRTMTLEDLDTAFQEGVVHENTYVVLVGSNEWQTLGEVAGLGGEASDGDASESEADAQDQSATHGPAAEATAPPYASANAAFAAGPQPQPVSARQPPSLPSGGGGAWPPVVTSSSPTAAAPFGAGPSAGVSSTPSATYKSPHSTIPVVQDLPNLDLDTASFKTGKRSVVIGAVAAVVLAAGGIFGLTRLDQPELPKPEVPAAAAAALTTATPWKRPEPTPAATPPSTTTTTTTTASTTSATDSTGGGRLSEDMKRALLSSDQTKKEQKRSSKRAAAPARKSSGKKAAAAGSGGPFKGGGDGHDPLNSNL